MPHSSSIQSATAPISRGQWLVLIGALLGWMFDGMEMGVFSLVGRSALQDLLKAELADLLAEDKEKIVGFWFSVVMAGFLVGASVGGVLFGWLGDRIGRVRAMSLSVLTYATFTALCGLAKNTEQVAMLRFLGALGMGGEYALGVSLVMESWPNRSRVVLAGLIGAAGNAGYLVIALLGLGLSSVLDDVAKLFISAGMSSEWVERLTAHQYQGWRLLMLAGAAPALLTFLFRLFVPESDRWEHEKQRGTTSHWAARDLIGVVVGACGPLLIIFLWAKDGIPLGFRILGTLAGIAVALAGYLFPVVRYAKRLQAAQGSKQDFLDTTVRRMLLAAALSGVALLGSWASMQWAPTWADQLAGESFPKAKGWTQVCSSSGAMVGTMLAALAAGWLSRRATYRIICIAAFVSLVFMYRANHEFGAGLLASVFVAGMCSASIYGWLPLYLPELFRTSVRATGQGFGYNFGRVIAAIGVLQTGNLMGLFAGKYAVACSVMAGIYMIGFLLIQFAPETRGKPLPE